MFSPFPLIFLLYRRIYWFLKTVLRFAQQYYKPRFLKRTTKFNRHSEAHIIFFVWIVKKNQNLQVKSSKTFHAANSDTVFYKRFWFFQHANQCPRTPRKSSSRFVANLQQLCVNLPIYSVINNTPKVLGPQWLVMVQPAVVSSTSSNIL